MINRFFAGLMFLKQSRGLWGVWCGVARGCGVNAPRKSIEMQLADDAAIAYNSE